MGNKGSKSASAVERRPQHIIQAASIDDEMSSIVSTTAYSECTLPVVTVNAAEATCDATSVVTNNASLSESTVNAAAPRQRKFLHRLSLKEHSKVGLDTTDSDQPQKRPNQPHKSNSMGAQARRNILGQRNRAHNKTIDAVTSQSSSEDASVPKVVVTDDKGSHKPSHPTPPVQLGTWSLKWDELAALVRRFPFKTPIGVHQRPTRRDMASPMFGRTLHTDCIDEEATGGDNDADAGVKAAARTRQASGGDYRLML